MLQQKAVTISKNRLNEYQSEENNVTSSLQSEESLLMFLNPMVIALQISVQK